jgi:ribosomal protein S18 acetylase RimI-like enzyme
MRYTLETSLDFIKQNPCKPYHSEKLCRRFLTELISRPEHIFYYTLQDQLMAVAVLADLTHNTINKANLEILGAQQACDKTEIVSYFVQQAQRVQPVTRDGFQISLHHDIPVTKEAIKQMGLYLGYETASLDLTRTNFSAPPATLHDLRAARPTEGAEIYALLMECFKNNPDLNTTTRDVWLQTYVTDPDIRYIVCEKHGALVGFCASSIDTKNKIYVRTLGVLESHRQQKIGHDLLTCALKDGFERGADGAYLSLWLQNQNALLLYQYLGFTITDHYGCYFYIV